ncbi:MAG: hypothetical protein DWQ31_17160 [Planctomycetota bacterium]|nr:MAG: hypothetical protein DWQ31_17160 [Planctomycetota bacterium]REJ92083.1 MAG: hypothetical protein DWQ35_13110 [Planctomycetota bacterium]REK28619.1 MAG: hypothetical protein DWQ42_04700 [Planctomycetota bacterium]REK39233.1 MAG: hypothetical protein DWQ46_18280 [Planctomycetota bacterium]
MAENELASDTVRSSIIVDSDVLAGDDAPNVAIEYDAGRLEAIRESARRLLQSMLSDHGCECVWGWKESIWPGRLLRDYRDLQLASAVLVLVPLSRIGQMEGKSGSLVLIGYLADAEHDEIPHSHPLVVKTIPKSKGAKLQTEYENGKSIKPFAYDQKDVFAIPFCFDEEHPAYNVLWSIFSASEPLWTEGVDQPNLVVRDLRNLITAGDDENVKAVLSDTFKTLRNLHFPFGKVLREPRRFGEEYEWYKREFGHVWGDEWVEFWGDSDQQHVEIDGEQRTNPLWVLRKLDQVEKEITVGAVHGDLHPGNIVLSATGQARIIDFGWSHDRAHVAKDFALLECNLRFLTLRTQLSAGEVQRFAQWIEWDAVIPDGLGDYCRGRAELVRHLRSLARSAYPEDTDWDWEYAVPLFMIAFGLLRFAPQLGNQPAAIETVLSLSDHIGRLLIDEGAATSTSDSTNPSQ